MHGHDLDNADGIVSFRVLNIGPIHHVLLYVAVYNTISKHLQRGHGTLTESDRRLIPSQIAKFMGPTWGPPGSCRPHVGPMLAPWTLLSGIPCWNRHKHRRNIYRSWLTDVVYFDGLMQDCCISNALALETLQSCTKPSIFLYLG